MKRSGRSARRFISLAFAYLSLVKVNQSAAEGDMHLQVNTTARGAHPPPNFRRRPLRIWMQEYSPALTAHLPPKMESSGSPISTDADLHTVAPSQVLQWLDQGKQAGKYFILIDLRREDHEVGTLPYITTRVDFLAASHLIDQDVRCKPGLTDAFLGRHHKGIT